MAIGFLIDGQVSGLPANLNSIGGAVTTDATGVKLSYTVPTGRTAKIDATSLFLISGAPTVDLEIVQGGTTVKIRRDTANYSAVQGLSLQAADVIRHNVTTAAVAGSTADVTIHVREYPAAATRSRVSLSPLGDAVDGQGLVIAGGNGLVIIPGDLATRPWSAIAADTATVVSVVEWYLPPGAQP